MSPDCENLRAFLDGELSHEDRVRFQVHLAACEACAARFHDLLQLDLLSRLALEDAQASQAAIAARRVLEEVPAGAASEHEEVPDSAQVGGDWDEDWSNWEEPSLHPPVERADAVDAVEAPRRGHPVRAGLQRWRWHGLGGMALAAGLAVVVALPGGGPEAASPAWLAPGLKRHLEARLTYGAVDVHRAYEPMRGADTPVTLLPLHDLAELERNGDLHGIVTAYLLHGDPRQALAFLRGMAPSADRDSDQAVAVALAGPPEPGKLDEALGLLDGALRRRPDHPQALWNRALVLRDLELPLLAADSFEAVERRGEPGWSEEARGQARQLREKTLARGRAWKNAYAATRDLMTDPEARLPLEEAERLPGIVRVAFYDAVRAAPSRDAVLRLAKLAEVLDRAQGGTVLRDYVARVAERDFRKRGPLARGYARLARGEHPAREAFLEELRRSGEDDLYVGALGYELDAGRPVDVDGFTRAAEGLGDPWFHLLAEKERAAREVREGRWWKAEARALAALRVCQERRLLYRCADLRLWLTDFYLDLHRPADASVHALAGWQLAKKQEEWRYEQRFLQELAQVARFRDALPSASAYLRESLARMPDDCARRSFVHRDLALVAWQDFRAAEARQELEQAMECGQPLGLPGALVLSDMARMGSAAVVADPLRRALSALRRAQPRPGERALMDFIEGQLVLERDRDAGRSLLWSAIEQAERYPDDADARRARAQAYAALVSEAGRLSAFDEALALVGRALRLSSVPDRCALAVSVQHERTLAVARGVSGTVVGSFAVDRAAPLGQDASGLVPQLLHDALRGCEHVDVLAPAPVNGLPRLLPVDVAWSYRVGRREPEAGGAVEGAHLIVSGVEVPALPGLRRLPALEHPVGPDPWRVPLEGDRATPARVLEAMGTASEVELHAPGLFSPEPSDASLLVLSPEQDGGYVLTAAQVAERKLAGAPLVLLAACGAAPFPHESSSLPVAFIEAGARTVLASTGCAPAAAGRFFEAVRERIRTGTRPGVALRDERRHWLAVESDADWVRDVLVFE